MGRAFSILRACLDERQETCYSVLIRASAFLKYNRISFFCFVSGTLLMGSIFGRAGSVTKKVTLGSGLVDGGLW